MLQCRIAHVVNLTFSVTERGSVLDLPRFGHGRVRHTGARHEPARGQRGPTETSCTAWRNAPVAGLYF